jgi:hypothetical protein
MELLFREEAYRIVGAAMEVYWASLSTSGTTRVWSGNAS